MIYTGMDALPVISAWSIESIGNWFYSTAGSHLNTLTSGAWWTSNRAQFYPFFISKPIQVQALWLMNGAVVSGNVDLGIYGSSGAKIVSTGSTAQAGTNQIQKISITPIILPPGQYYMALAIDNITATCFVTSAFVTQLFQASGAAQQNTAFPLPSSATLATVAVNKMYLFGLTNRTFV